MSLFHEQMDLYFKEKCTIEQQIERWMEQGMSLCSDVPKSFLPKIYQSLPKQNKKSRKYRDEFSDVELIKKLLLQKINLSFYRKKNWALQKKITLFTYVLEDGMGDLIASDEVKNILERGGFVSVVQVFLLPEKYRGLSILTDRSYCHFFKGMQDLHFSHFSPDIQEVISNADLLFQLPTFYPFWQELTNKFMPPSTFTLAEYGFVNSLWASPKNEKILSMGLHFLEIGIIIKCRDEKLQRCSAVQNEISPSLPWNQFTSQSDFIFAYLLDSKGLFIFLTMAFNKYAKSKKTLVIALVDASLFLLLIKENTSFLKEHHIKELRLRLKAVNYLIPISSTGKTLEIVELGVIKQSDVSFLYQSSKRFCACRGNQSFSEVISYNALYFFDPAPHSQPFLMDLCAVASHCIKQYPGAIEYIRGFYQLYHLKKENGGLSSLASRMSYLVCQSSTIKGLKLLSKILQKEYNASNLITKIILRELYLSRRMSANKELRF